MASGNKLVIAFLSVSNETSSDQLIEQIKLQKLDDFSCVFVKLTQQDLDSFQPGDTYDAIVLLHLISQGRNSITDVASAKYSKLLPQLKRIYGPDRVAVVVHSMTSFNSNTKMALMMDVFKKSQPTTFQCSKCVIQCNNLAEMPAEDLSRLTEFLGKVPSHPLPIAEVEAPKTQMVSGTSDTAHVSQASPKVDTLPDRYVTQDKVNDITYPIALISLSSSNQPNNLQDGLRREFPGKKIMLIKDIHGLAINWHFFETILVDLGSLPEAASYSSNKFNKIALDIYQKCLEEMLVPQNIALLMLAPTNPPADHKCAPDIISQFPKLYEVPVFQYSSESCRPPLFDDFTNNRLFSWLLDCCARQHTAANKK